MAYQQDMSIGLAFESETSSNTISVPYPAFMFGKFGNHVIRAVINRFDTFKFSNLKDSYSNLESIKELYQGLLIFSGNQYSGICQTRSVG